MQRYLARFAVLTLLAVSISVHPSHAETGFLRVTFTKGGFVAGAGVGRGVLTYEGREHRFRVSGLSLGLTIGLSTNRLAGRVAYLSQLSDFAGTYVAVGGGAAWAGGIGGVQLRNEKGVIITLQGPKVGMELSANLSGIKIAFE